MLTFLMGAIIYDYIGQQGHIGIYVMGTTLVQFQSCSVCGCLEPRPGFFTAKAALNLDRMKVSCSMVSPCYIIIMIHTLWKILKSQISRKGAEIERTFSNLTNFSVNKILMIHKRNYLFENHHDIEQKLTLRNMNLPES